MWPAVFRQLLGLSAALGVGWSIRLMDDALDQEVDQAVGRANLQQLLQGGTTAYALLTLVLAILANQSVALSLFAGAYAVGMADDGRRLPSGLPGWAEGLLVFALVMLQVGWRYALAGGLIMVAVQLLDDWSDRQLDSWKGAKTIPQLLGPVGVWMTASLATALATALSPVLVGYSLPAFLFFQWREQAVKRHAA